VREAANRAKCQNNLKQIALACHNYHDVNDGFPLSDGFTPINGYECPYITYLFPYLEVPSSFTSQWFSDDTSYDARYAANSHALAALTFPFMACPSDTLPNPPVDTLYGNISGFGYCGLTSYICNTGLFTQPDLGLFGSYPVRLTDVTDGVSNTLLLGEKSHY